MYMGGNKTALLSQRLIADALMRLLRVKRFSDITVSELCREAQVSRQTYYTLFGSLENVILFSLRAECGFDPAPERPACRSACFRDFCRGYSRYIVEKKELLALL